MKASEFVKYVIVPILEAFLLTALFRPFCIANGECDYLKLWFLSGIPFGIQRMYLWIIPKNYDIGGSMGIIAINLLVGGVIGGLVLVWRLAVAVIYLGKAVILGTAWIVKKTKGKHCKFL